MSSGELTFSVDSLLLSELGERLVTRKYIALAELIKNSYDADASEVTVILRNVRKNLDMPFDPSKAEISIVDTGHGMTFNQVKQFWMIVATPAKIREPISPRFGRVKTGDKGVGRFACRSLAGKLILDTTAKNESGKFEHTHVEFDWSKFVAGTPLTQIPNNFTTSLTDDTQTGLNIKLLSVREGWLTRDFDVLRRQIIGLTVAKGIRRAGYDEDPGFDIIFDAPEFDKEKGPVAEEVMDAGWGRLKGTLNQQGVAIFDLQALRLGKLHYELPSSFNTITGASFDIAMIWKRKDHCRKSKILTLGIVDELMSEWSGVRVYLDGFRVYPYGDPGNDWLDIDKEVGGRLTKTSNIFTRVAENLVGVDQSRAMLNHPMNKNLVGRVFVSNQPERIFNVTINRIGFVEDEAFAQLKEFIRRGLEWATLHYAHFVYLLAQDEVREKAKSLHEAVEKGRIEPSPTLVESALDVMQDAAATSTKDPEKVKEVQRNAKDARRIVETSISHLEKQTNVLRTVAATGGLMLAFVHEARDLIGTLETHAATLERLARSLNKVQRSELLDLAKKLRSAKARFQTQVQLVTGISADLSATTRRKLLIKDVLEEIEDCFVSLLARFNIVFEKRIPTDLRTGPMLESELYAILLNLLSNAVKVVIAAPGHRIMVQASHYRNGTVLRVYDDGIGLSKQQREAVFKPLVSDPEGRLYTRLEERLEFSDLAIVGEGSGMGLSTVREIVEAYGKSAKFIDTKKPWVTCVEVTLP